MKWLPRKFGPRVERVEEVVSCGGVLGLGGEKTTASCPPPASVWVLTQSGRKREQQPVILASRHITIPITFPSSPIFIFSTPPSALSPLFPLRCSPAFRVRLRLLMPVRCATLTPGWWESWGVHKLGDHGCTTHVSLVPFNLLHFPKRFRPKPSEQYPSSQYYNKFVFIFKCQISAYKLQRADVV